jgi:hypothetical protein
MNEYLYEKIGQAFYDFSAQPLRFGASAVKIFHRSGAKDTQR